MNLCADTKGITATTLIRLGILRGKGRILFNAAKFKKDYHLLEQDAIQRYYEDLTNKLQTMPYGPFHALRMTIGHHDAVRLAKEGNECDVPDSVLNALSKQIATTSNRVPSPSQSRKRARVYDDNDDIEGETIDLTLSDE